MSGPPWPRAALFDWDNTLVDNWQSIRNALNAALADAGKAPFSMEEVMISGRRSSRDAFPSLFGENWRRAREIFLVHFRENHLAGLQVLPGAEELLDILGERGVSLGIVSNKLGDLLRREVAHLGWSSRFVGVVGAQDAPADKPDPAPIRLALDGAGIEAGADVWVVGDTDIDMRAALSAGCSGILVGPGPYDAAMLETMEPISKFHSCIALAGFVRGNPYTIS